VRQQWLHKAYTPTIYLIGLGVGDEVDKERSCERGSLATCGTEARVYVEQHEGPSTLLMHGFYIQNQVIW
jgi:hypothetical protein